MNNSRTIYFLIILLIGVFLPCAVFAVESRQEQGCPRELRYNLKTDLVVSGIAASGWLITAAAQDQLLPANCRWCQVDSFDKWGHNNIKWSNTGVANKAVYVTGYGLAPIAAFGLDAFAAGSEGKLSAFPVDALLIIEATAVSSFATQIVKIATARQRPNAHYGNGSQSPNDNNSFYSGHTSLAFSLAASSGTVASMRGYKFAPLVWGTGMAIAATTAYLSLAADRHYLTDVITGAALGSAIGFGIPYLFHRPRHDKDSNITLSAVPVSGGGLLTLNGRW